MSAADYFLKIDGVDGESLDDKHKGSIELESFSWGATQKVVGGGGGMGAGKVSIQDFHFVKKIDKASPKLFLACCTGQHFSKVTLTARKAGKGQQEYLKVVLTDVMVSGFQTAGSGAGENPVPNDQVTLNFAKFNFDYSPQKADGSLDGAVKVGYDLKANKSI